MKHSDNTPSPTLDDRLADFADRALVGTAKQPDPHAEDDLRDLEQVVLRLQQAALDRPLSEADIRRMQARFNARVRRAQTQPFWKAWFGGGQPQVRFALTGLAVLAAILLLVPFMNLEGQSVTGAAGVAPQSRVILTAAVVLVAGFLFWLSRRK
jgi:hypothetical protein